MAAEVSPQSDSQETDEQPAWGFVYRVRYTVTARAQKIVDAVTPHLGLRWLVTAFLAVLYLIRVVLVLQGFYVVTYVLGIYLLNLFIGFLSPQVDPDSADGGPRSITVDDEFRPYQRQIPEIKFWSNATFSIYIAFGCTYFPIFDIPVFWPALLMYFLSLATMTLKNQIKHMIRHRYLPFSYGKKIYTAQAT
ncbi:Protein RER1 [Pelomyxa schiedti]|nr:Protein RER1 [Pelomyxa schiedti]